MKKVVTGQPSSLVPRAHVRKTHWTGPFGFGEICLVAATAEDGQLRPSPGDGAASRGSSSSSSSSSSSCSSSSSSSVNTTKIKVCLNHIAGPLKVHIRFLHDSENGNTIDHVISGAFSIVDVLFCWDFYFGASEG